MTKPMDLRFFSGSPQYMFFREMLEEVMGNNKNKKNNDFMEKSVIPDSSKTYDGQNLSVMQGVMGQKYDEKADRSSSIWKTIKRIIIIAIVVFCFLYVVIAILQGNGILLPKVR